MDHIKQLEALYEFYAKSAKELAKAPEPVRAEIEHRRNEAWIALQGARGAMGLNPMTGAPV